MEEKKFSVRDLLSTFRGKDTTKRFWIFLLILLPSIIAIVVFFILSNNYYRSPEKQYEITVYDNCQNLVVSDSGFPDLASEDSAVSIFSAITLDLSRPSALPAFIDQNECIRAYVKYMNSVNEYVLYFSVEDKIGYLSHGGNVYLISEENTERFLGSVYSQSFYDAAVPAVLYGNAEVEILPREASWSYKNIGGEFLETDRHSVSNEKAFYNMSGAIDLDFDVDPDVFKVIVSKDGVELFSGDYSELSGFVYDKSDILTVEVRAEWLKKENSKFFGKMNYIFDVSISEKAEFTISGEEFAVDSVCVISCTNIIDPDRIKITSIPLLPSVPEFTMSGQNAMILVPIVRNVESDVYDIRISYGVSYKSFKIKVLPERTSNAISSFVSEDKLKLGLSDDCAQEFGELREFVAEQSKGDKLYGGEFLDYISLGAQAYCQYGDVYYNAYQKYNSKGCEYRFSDAGSTKIGAMNSGRVIKTGYNDDLGNYVIISHGCGLATWYAHLDSIEVLSGDHVIKGETIGKAGMSGLSSEENLFVIVTLGTNLIDPATVCGNSFE